MHTTISRNRLYNVIGRTAAVTFLAAAGTLGLNAQQSAGTAPALSAVNLKASLIAPLDLSIPNDLNYSSSVGSTETASAESYFLGDDADQPPPRRRYSRPNYHDNHTNSDGSPKYFFLGGVGFGVPTGGTHSNLTTGWGIQVGGGRNFNKRFGVDLQFDYDHFGFQTATLNNLLNVYNNAPYFAEDQNGDPLSQLGGSSHVWSFTLNPRYTFYDSDKWGAYAVIGGGFYHKTATFTTPAIVEEESFFGPIAYQANQPIDSYTSNAPGVSGGFGVTYKASHFASQRFYAEARYVYIANQYRPYSEGAFGNTGSSAGANIFPANSATTTYIPVKFGIIF